ncbi:hypothetical protein C8R43DRAFT_945017 [Mycena crocata]|nr:hypothetical protein C8R43DRAFT_945017 [Mycena crocata]
MNKVIAKRSETSTENHARAFQRQSKYYECIEIYKGSSWFNFPEKLQKKKDVREAKRLTRESNHVLRNLTESMHSGSETSSIYASAGSPPGSNLAIDEIERWRYDVLSSTDNEDREISTDDDVHQSRANTPTAVRCPCCLADTAPILGSFCLCQSPSHFFGSGL